MRRLCVSFLMILSTFLNPIFSYSQSRTPHQNSYFSGYYQEARGKFIEAAQENGADLESFQNPHAGPDNEKLYMDVAAIGLDGARDFIVLGSGTHGVEGFAGSGIQTGLFKQGMQSILKQNVGIIMIHAINPYGFAHLRRANEDNIDLNRNFIDHTKPYPENEGYKELADVLLPKSLTTWTEMKLRIRLLWYRLKYGSVAMKRAVSGDQFSHPTGIFFGGHHEAWSNRTLKKIVKRYLSNAKRVVFIDFHTGLGPFGSAEIILNVSADSPEYRRAVQMWGDRVRTTVSGSSVSVHLHAPLKLAIPKMVPQAEVTAVSLEFGTYPAKEVFLALWAENWLYHHAGDNHPKTQEIKAELLRVFYPNTDEWKQLIWNHGQVIVDQALRHFQ